MTHARSRRQAGSRCDRAVFLRLSFANGRLSLVLRRLRRAGIPLLALLGVLAANSVALGGERTVPARSAVAVFGQDSAFLFTTQFCEQGQPSTCLDGHPGVKDGRAVLPVLVAAPGETIKFEVGFPSASLRLNVQATGVEATTSLDDGTWQVPDDLPRPAWLRLEAASDTRSGTFLAVLDRTAPGPSLRQPRILATRTRAGNAIRYDIRLQLCSQQTGDVRVRVVDEQAGRALRVQRVLPALHTPGCRSYLVRAESNWKGGSTVRLLLRARVGESLLSSPRRFTRRATSG